jgi:hypothetical protein
MTANLKDRQDSQLIVIAKFRTAVVLKSHFQNTVIVDKAGCGKVAMYRTVSNETSLMSNIFIIHK